MATVSFQQDWISSGRLQRVLKKINSGTSVNSEGNIQFEDFEFKQYFDLISDAFRFPEQITQDEASSIVYRACIDIRKKGQISQGDLRIIVNDLTSAALSIPNRPFTMWTHLRIKQLSFSSGFRIEFDNVSIQGSAHLSSRYHLDEYILNGHGRIYPNKLSSYGYLIFRCEARNENDAARKIFDAGDAFFAACNLAWRSINLWTDRHVQANLWMGPYQFFWDGRKFLGHDKVWYNPNFDQDEWDRFPKNAAELHKHLPGIRKVLKRLECHPLRGVLLSTAKLLHEGMASTDLSFRLLRFWSALETLYSEGGSKNVPNERIIKRAVFAEKDRELTKMKLEHLARLRNDYVHSGKTEREKNDLSQSLRELIAQQLVYLIMHASDIVEHSELIEMADLPDDLSLLAKRKIAISRRENIIKLGRHR